MKTKVIIPFKLYLATLVIIPQVLIATIINVPVDQPTIQAGINASSNGDTVLVQPDTYYQNINFNGKNITVASLFLTTGDTSYISQTIINGNNNNSVVKFTSGESNSAVLSGLTITNGSAYYGSGIYCYSGSSPTLNNLLIIDNHGYSGDSYGGGICIMSDIDLIASNLTITNNSANVGGGIYFHDNGNATMSTITMSNNTSGHGGAMLISYSSPVIDHGVFYTNNSPFGGAVYVSNYSTPEFINCTFSKNEADYGGAFYCHDLGGQPTITNCILWEDVCSYNLEIFATSSYYAPIVTYTDVENGPGQNWFGTGCIDMDPLFLDPENHAFHLTADSPCINTGDPSSPTDPDGSQADMGAYYFNVIQLPGMAYDPIPENNANDVETDLILYWINGENTETIDLYFGTENPPVTLALENEPSIESHNPGQLEPVTTYYWRVNCKNEAGTIPGEVWNFTTGINTLLDEVIDPGSLMKIFPNPGKDNVVIRSGYEILSVQLFSSHGNLVFTSEQIAFSTTLNISDLAPGIYIVKCKTKVGDFSDFVVIR